MASVVLVSPRGEEFIVSEIAEFTSLVYGQGYSPKTGTVGENRAAVMEGVPLPPHNYALDPVMESEVFDSATGKLRSDRIPEQLSEAALRGALVPRVVGQAAESALQRMFTAQPFTPGWAPYTIDFNSAPNSGAAAGTYNRTMHFGFNAGRHSGGEVVEGKPAIYMGFEDNYFDHDDDETYGVEWYVGYVSPDGESVPVGSLRPFYVRVMHSDDDSPTNKSAIVKLDIGQGPDGSLTIWGGVTEGGEQLAAFNHTDALLYKKLSVLGSIQSTPQTGVARLLMQSAVGSNANAQFQFGVNGVMTFMFEADRFGEVYLWDNANNRIHTNFVRGASSDASLLDVRASLKVQGKAGFFNTEPIAKRGATPDATDLATALTLVNAIKADLVAYGLKAA